VRPGDLRLRDVIELDLPLFFEHQRDPIANHMAAFTARDPDDREAFMGKWASILGNEAIVKKSILYNGRLVGHVVSFEHAGRPEVTYWLDRAYWGRGLATRSLALFVGQLKRRPLYARAAKDNAASIRVLEKCGFVIAGVDKGFANARGQEIEEFILRLDAKAAGSKVDLD
jgi:RimJ/RimL family protein N-acetyltransferase